MNSFLPRFFRKSAFGSWSFLSDAQLNNEIVFVSTFFTSALSSYMCMFAYPSVWKDNVRFTLQAGTFLHAHRSYCVFSCPVIFYSCSWPYFSNKQICLLVVVFHGTGHNKQTSMSSYLTSFLVPFLCSYTNSLVRFSVLSTILLARAVEMRDKSVGRSWLSTTTDSNYHVHVDRT